MDSKEDATYRLNLARFHLEQAKKSFDSQLYPIAAKDRGCSIAASKLEKTNAKIAAKHMITTLLKESLLPFMAIPPFFSY